MSKSKMRKQRCCIIDRSVFDRDTLQRLYAGMLLAGSMVNNYYCLLFSNRLWNANR
jgi:hypothetical protein